MWIGPSPAPRAKKFPNGSCQFEKDKTIMCNNKSHCKSLNTFQIYRMCCFWHVRFWISQVRWQSIIRADRHALKAKLVSRKDTAADQVRMQVWHENTGILIIIYLQPACQMIKSIFNQQALCGLITHNKTPEGSRMLADYFCGCVNNWGGP